MPTPDRNDIYKWIVDAFDVGVSEESIRNTFASIGLVDKAAYSAIANDANDVVVHAPTIAEDNGMYDEVYPSDSEVECDGDDDDDDGDDII